MRPPLAPIQARACEAAPQFPRFFEVDAKCFKSVRSLRGKIVRGAAIGPGGGNPAERNKSIVQRDAQGAGHVVIASARGAQPGWRSYGPVAKAPGKYAEPFQRAGHIRPRQSI
jgi:hypothetical protein